MKIHPPNENVKAIAEWCGVFLVTIGLVSIVASIPFWVSGKQSPFPVIADQPEKPDRIRQWLDNHQESKCTDDFLNWIRDHEAGDIPNPPMGQGPQNLEGGKDFRKPNEDKAILHLHFDIGPDGKMRVQKNEIQIPQNDF